MDNNSLMLIDNNGSFEIDDQSQMDVDASHNQSVALLTPTRPNEDGPNADTDEGSLPEPGTQPGKRRRKKSMVWEHFTIETASPGSTKACCKHCRKSFAYITGQKLAGTSHLKRHIQLGICPMSRETHPQLAPTSETKDPPKKRQRLSATYMNVPLNQDRCYNEMAKMIIMHEYPLHMVEHSGFTGFVQALRPQFTMASFNTIHADCVTMYLSEKQKLSNFITEIPGRVNLTVDLWTSNQSVGYAFVTGHFIDRDWNLTHRLLNVAVVPSPDSDFALNQPIAACLSDWNLERKLSSLTVGQSVVNKTSIENLRCCLSVRNQHVMNGQLLLGNCYARLLSSMAQDVLGTEDLETPIKKVRDSVKYVKTKDSSGERFDELKKQLQTPSTKDLCIDNLTKWDTTYNMLLAAHEHKEVFSCLGNCDLDYKMSTSPEEWRKIEILCSCLMILFDAANVLTRPIRLTANDLYHEMTKLQLELNHAAMSEDPDVRNLATPMREKFDEYWRGCFLLLAVAVVMDPRFKMKLIEFSFSKAYGEDAEKWIRSVDDAIRDLYHDYAEQSHSLMDAYVGHGNDGFSETDMSQVRFHHEYHHSNGLTHDQIYGQPEDGNPLNEKPRDPVLDGHESQEVAQTQVNRLATESLPHVQEEKIAEPLLQEDQSGHPIEEVPLENQRVDDKDLTHDTQPVEEMLEDTQPVEEVAHEEVQVVEKKHDDIQPDEEMLEDTQPVEEVAHEVQVVEKEHDDIQPVEEVGDETESAEEMLEETQPVATQLVEEKRDDIQHVEEVGDETEPVDEMLEETQPVEEVAQEAQLVEEKHDDMQPVKEIVEDTQPAESEAQPVEGILEDAQPVEEAAQEAPSVEHSQNPQNADGLFRQEGEAVQQLDEGIASEQHPSAVQHVGEAQDDSQSHAMPQEEAAAFTISQEGHHVDVLLQEGHHLEASSQEFPLITIGDGFSDFELYISEVGSHQQMKSELDQYLEESLIPRSQDFEILGWWSLNRTKYPTLSKMAADVLSLPFCTVSPDSVFNTEVKKMDNYRSSLQHVTLEALFCAKDWFKHGSSTSTSENNLKRES
uniref:Zinc finger BED domain-containing protein DAYSLEEPER n=3 Tax=Noccaea caerulescens TaxID=107243 RepID=A0A1J3EGJ5_NOCCA